MLIVEAVFVGGGFAVAGDESCFVIDEAVLQDVVQQQNCFMRQGGVLVVPGKHVKLVCAAGGVCRPAGTFEISKIMPAHYVAVFVDKARLGTEFASERHQSPLGKSHRVTRGIENRIVRVLRHKEAHRDLFQL